MNQPFPQHLELVIARDSRPPFSVRCEQVLLFPLDRGRRHGMPNMRLRLSSSIGKSMKACPM